MGLTFGRKNPEGEKKPGLTFGGRRKAQEGGDTPDPPVTADPEPQAFQTVQIGTLDDELPPVTKAQKPAPSVTAEKAPKVERPAPKEEYPKPKHVYGVYGFVPEVTPEVQKLVEQLGYADDKELARCVNEYQHQLRKFARDKASPLNEIDPKDPPAYTAKSLQLADWLKYRLKSGSMADRRHAEIRAAIIKTFKLEGVE